MYLILEQKNGKTKEVKTTAYVSARERGSECASCKYTQVSRMKDERWKNVEARRSACLVI